MEESEWRLRALSPLDGTLREAVGALRRRFLGGRPDPRTFRASRWRGSSAWRALPGIGELAPLTGRERAASRRLGGQVRRRRSQLRKADRGHYQPRRESGRVLPEAAARSRSWGWPPARAEFAHFAATSEDINNLAYARMVRRGL